MKHQLKRFTGLLLALIMLLGMVPVSAAPAAADTYVSNVITPIPMDEPEPEEESDPFADLETEEDFLASFRGQTFKGPYNERLVAVAETQLGYTESERNFIYKEENGEKQKMGYTRYGAWYGPGFDYESWCAMFISFCLHYAEVPEELMPRDSGVITWMHTLQRSGLYRERGEYMAKPGDLIFFDWDLDGRGDHVGIVHSTFWQDGVEMVRTIEGNHTRTVEYFTYPRYSYEIMGYGCTPYEDPDAVKALFTTDYLSLDGSTYRVTLTCDSDAGIPKGTQLSVSEVSADPYLASTAEALSLGEEDILVYTRFFDIKLIKDGVEIEPLTPVQVSVDLLDLEEPAGTDGVQVVHFAEDGTKALDGSSEDGSSVTFMADSFSVYGFGVALRPVAKEESSLADVTLYSTSPSSAPSVSQPELDAPVEGLETMSVLTVGSSDETGGKTFVRASLKDASALSETESLALYTVESNRVTDVLVDSLSADAKLISLPASTEGVALVKDTGYRRLSFETEEVALTGMMPKASDAQVQNVTSAYAAFQPAADPAEDLSLNPEEVSDPTVLAAYTISLTDNGTAYTPDDSRPLQVSFIGEAIVAAQTRGSDLTVWQLSADGTETPVTDVTASDGALSFTATDVSTYVITERKLKQTITASDGNTYEITVIYDDTTGIPANATLEVSEVLDDAAVEAAVSAQRDPSVKSALSRTFDIRILDENGVELQPAPGSNVKVTFALVEVENQNLTTNVYHLQDNGGSYTAQPLEVDSISGDKATVTTTGFSYYTVEFTYEGKQFVLDGEQTMRLDVVLAAIGLTGNIENAEVSDSSLFEAHHSWDGYWYVYANQPFSTNEWMKVTLDGIVYEVDVTDAYYGVSATGNPGAAVFARGMDIATITIQDLGRLTGIVTLDPNIWQDSGGRFYWNGTIAENGTKTLSGDQVKVKYAEAATTADGAKCDVEIVISDVVIYGDSRHEATGNFVFATLRPVSKGNTYPLALTAYPANTKDTKGKDLNCREGVKAKITVNVYQTGTTTPADGTFAFTIFDLNQNKSNTTWQFITDAANHHTFSEYVTVNGSAYDVYYNTERMMRTDSDIHPQPGSSGGHSYETGVAFLARSGASLIGYNGGGTEVGETSFYIMPRHGINHTITSYSGFGGSIATATSGNAADVVEGGPKYLPGGTVGDERVYAVPAGKQVSYLMTPEDGYEVKSIVVDNTPISITGTLDQNLTDNTDGSYTYTFPSVGTTHRINVTWMPSDDPVLPLGHISMEPGANGQVVHRNLQSLVNAMVPGHPTTTTINRNGIEKKIGSVTPQPPALTGYTRFTFALGLPLTDESGDPLGDDAIVPSSTVFYAKSDDLRLRYTENGEYEYSVSGRAWEKWTIKDSAGNPTVPTIYAVYTKDDTGNTHSVFVTTTAIARNTTDFTFVDPDLTIPFTEEIFEIPYTISITNANGADGEWDYTVTPGQASTINQSGSHTHKPGEAHGHYLTYTDDTKYITTAETSVTATLTAQYMVVTETAPSNYSLTSVDLKHGSRGISSIAAGNKSGAYTIYAGFPYNAVTGDLKNYVTVTRSWSSEFNQYMYSFSFTDPAQNTEVEFLNTRDTVELTLKELLEDARYDTEWKHPFSVTVRAEEQWNGRTHYSMLGTYTLTPKNFDTEGASTTVRVPVNTDILLIQRFGATSSENPGVKTTDYDTTVESNPTGIEPYRPLAKVYLLRGISADTTVTFTNRLKPRVVTVKKTLIGGDVHRKFDFTATILDSSGSALSGHSVYTDADGIEQLTDENGQVTFKLSGNGSIGLKVPYNAKVTVKEVKEKDDSYKTEVSVNNGTNTEVDSVTLPSVEANTDIVFTNTSDFSVYDPRDVVTFEFYLDSGLTAKYEFPVNTGNMNADEVVTSYRQILREGQVLTEPQTPVDASGKIFQGWYRSDTDNLFTDFGSKLTFGDTSDGYFKETAGSTVKLYAKFGTMRYVTFHEDFTTDNDQNAFWPVLKTVAVEKNSDNQYIVTLTGTEPLVEDAHREFKYWAYKASEPTAVLPLDDVDKIDGATYNFTEKTGEVHLYPIFQDMVVVTFYTGETGSGATYVPAVKMDEGKPVSDALAKISTAPTLAGYDFAGWYFDENLTDAVASNLTRAINSDTTLYAKWEMHPTAKFTVSIWAQAINDRVGMAANEKTYYLYPNGVSSYTGGTGVTAPTTTHAANGTLYVDYLNASGTQTSEVVANAPGTGFTFARTESSYINPDGSTNINVYYDRDVYTLIVRKGYQYDQNNPSSGDPYSYENTTTPSGTVYVNSGSSYVPVTFRMCGWQRSDGTILPVTSSDNPHVYSAYSTTLLGRFWTGSVYNNYSVEDGSTGTILETTATGIITSRTPVTAVYAWQDEDGNTYDFTRDSNGNITSSPFYFRHEDSTRGGVLDTYVGLYEAPLSVKPYNYLLYYTYRANTFSYYSCQFTDWTIVRYSTASQYTSNHYEASNSRGPLKNNFVTSQGRATPIAAPASFRFDNMLAISGMNYYDPLLITGTGATIYTNSTSTGTLLNSYVLRSNTEAIKSNLSADRKTLTMFVGAGTQPSSHLIYSYYYALPIPASSDAPVTSMDTYIQSYQRQINTGTENPLVEFFGNYTAGTLTIDNTSVSGNELAYYYSLNYDSQWHEVVLNSSGRTVFHYNEDNTNRIASYTKNGTAYYPAGSEDPTRVRLLYVPYNATVTFCVDNGLNPATAGTVTIPYNWNFSMFDPKSASSNPMKDYTTLYDLKIGESIDNLASSYTWVNKYLNANPDKSGKTFHGWYYDRDLTQRFHPGDEITQDITLFASWDEPWFVVQIDPAGGEIRGGDSGSTWFWTQRGTSVDSYDNLIKRDYDEYDEGTYYYHHYTYEGNGGTYDWDGDRVAGNNVNSLPRTALYTETDDSPNDRKTYRNIPSLWQLTGWDYKTSPDGVNWSDLQHNYIFQNPVTSHLKIIATWRKVAPFKIVYDPAAGTLKETGTSLDNLATDDTIYMDGAEVAISKTAEPNDKNKQFMGWKVKGGDEKLYKLGDMFTVSSGDADQNMVITLVAQYDSIHMTSLVYDADGGEGTLTDVIPRKRTDPVVTGVTPVAVDQYWDADTNTLKNIELNDTVVLSSGAGFNRKGFALIGWSKDDSKKENTTNTPNSFNPDGTVKEEFKDVCFALGQKAVIDGATGNVLYAVWVPVLSVTKEVTGDFGDPNKDFNFTLNVDGLTPNGEYRYICYTTQNGTSWTIENRRIDAAYNPGIIEADGAGRIVQTFKLKHHQRIDFLISTGIATVTEVNGQYRASYQIDGRTEVPSTTSPTTTDSIDLSFGHTVAFKNDLPAVAPTGVSMHTSPFAIMLLAGMMLLFPAAYRGRKRKKDSNI